MAILPQIGSTGVFRVRHPFDTIVNPTGAYECSGIRLISELLSYTDSVVDKYYYVYGLTRDDYTRDRDAGESIVTLKNGNDYIYIPASYIISFPDVTGIPYHVITLAVTLGAIPVGADLSTITDKISNLLTDTNGVVPDIVPVETSQVQYVSYDDDKLIKAKRAALISDRLTDTAKSRVNLELYEATIIKLRELENFISSTFALGKVNTSCTGANSLSVQRDPATNTVTVKTNNNYVITVTNDSAVGVTLDDGTKFTVTNGVLSCMALGREPYTYDNNTHSISVNGKSIYNVDDTLVVDVAKTDTKVYFRADETIVAETADWVITISPNGEPVIEHKNKPHVPSLIKLGKECSNLEDITTPETYYINKTGNQYSTTDIVGTTSPPVIPVTPVVSTKALISNGKDCSNLENITTPEEYYMSINGAGRGYTLNDINPTYVPPITEYAISDFISNGTYALKGKVLPSSIEEHCSYYCALYSTDVNASTPVTPDTPTEAPVPTDTNTNAQLCTYSLKSRLLPTTVDEHYAYYNSVYGYIVDEA
jgi:hypothetical protein